MAAHARLSHAIRTALPDASKRPYGEVMSFVLDAIRAHDARFRREGRLGRISVTMISAIATMKPNTKTIRTKAGQGCTVSLLLPDYPRNRPYHR
jgi:hypothetical protein